MNLLYKINGGHIYVPSAAICHFCLPVLRQCYLFFQLCPLDVSCAKDQGLPSLVQGGQGLRCSSRTVCMPLSSSLTNGGLPPDSTASAEVFYILISSCSRPEGQAQEGRGIASALTSGSTAGSWARGRPC